jgi:hypothetical protein
MTSSTDGRSGGEPSGRRGYVFIDNAGAFPGGPTHEIDSATFDGREYGPSQTARTSSGDTAEVGRSGAARHFKRCPARGGSPDRRD